MFDALLDVFDMLNVIDRVSGFLAGAINFERGTHHKRMKHRGLHTIHIARETGDSGQEIEDYLKSYHIPIHGRRITSKEIIFSVPDQQAEWAKYLLDTKGTSQQPTRWADQKEDRARDVTLNDILDALFGR